jgi:hypothetical protein
VSPFFRRQLAAVTENHYVTATQLKEAVGNAVCPRVMVKGRFTHFPDRLFF